MPQWKVTEMESGLKLIPFLRLKLGSDPSASLLKRSLETNLCLINDRVERFGSIALGRGDIVDFTLAETSALTCKFSRAGFFKVLYSDADLVIIDKPPGLASDDPTLLEMLKSSSEPLEPLKLAHRLDKDTSGVLIFARSDDILKKLIALFRDRKVKKKYLALVDRVPKARRGIVKNYLGKLHTYQGQSLWGQTDKANGVLAETEWKLVGYAVDCALIMCMPVTGRTHQLRVHLSGMGHPILGDKQYAKLFRCSYRPKRCLLHALEIHFPHPVTLKPITVTAPLPLDFTEALRTLGLSMHGK